MKTYEEMLAEEVCAIFTPNTRFKADAQSICKYNHQVDCSNATKCYRCGWNPQVAKQRAQRIRRRLDLEKD